jgi:hypothetical protein
VEEEGRARLWDTCEMKWCVLGMKPYANLFIYKAER